MCMPPKEQLDASIVEKVLDAVAKERQDAHDALDAANAALNAAAKRENAALAPLGQAFADASAAMAAHVRYEALLPRQDWDAMKRTLQAGLDEATTSRDDAIEAAERRLAAPRRKAKTLLDRCRLLAEEWGRHERIAKASGVDLNAYWTPERGEPTPLLQEEEADPGVPM